MSSHEIEFQSLKWTFVFLTALTRSAIVAIMFLAVEKFVVAPNLDFLALLLSFAAVLIVIFAIICLTDILPEYLSLKKLCSETPEYLDSIKQLSDREFARQVWDGVYSKEILGKRRR